MRRNLKKKTSIYQYLDSCVVLEKGTEEDFVCARKKYWRQYKANWRRQKRKAEKELTTSWNKDELKILSEAARKHRKSKTSFIKQATLAYINKTYIVPDNYTIREIAQSLMMVYNSIREMMDENALPLQTGKVILGKIVDLERQVLVSLHNPRTLDELITEAITTNSETKARLHQMLATPA